MSNHVPPTPVKIQPRPATCRSDMNPPAEGLAPNPEFRQNHLNSCKGLEKLAKDSGILKAVKAVSKMAETSYALPVKMMNKIYAAAHKLCPANTEELCFVDVPNVPLRHHPNGHFDSRPDFVSLSKSLYNKLKRKKIPIAWHHITNAAELKRRAEKAKGAGQCADYLGLANQALPNRVGILGVALSAAGYTLHWSTASGLESSEEFAWSDIMPLLEYAYTLYVPKDRHLHYDDTVTLSGGLALDEPPKWDIVTHTTVYKCCTVKMVGEPWHRMSWIAVTSDAQPFIIKDQYRSDDFTFTEGELYDTLHKAGFALGFADCVEYFEVESHNKVITVGSDEQSRTKTRIILATSGSPLASVDGLHSLCKVMYDATECHRYAVNNGVLHRDISMANILINPKQARTRTSLPYRGKNRPRFIDEVLHDDPNAESHALLIDLDNACKLERKEVPKAGSLHERTGTPKYIARSVAQGLVLKQANQFVPMPELPEHLAKRYEDAHTDPPPSRSMNEDEEFDDSEKIPTGNDDQDSNVGGSPQPKDSNDAEAQYVEPLRIFNDTEDTCHSGRIDTEKQKRYRADASLYKTGFHHHPRHDAESIFWVILVMLLRALPVKANGPKNDVNNDQFKQIWEAFDDHEISSWTDTRQVIFAVNGWDRVLHEELSFVAPVIEELIDQISPEYEFLKPAPDPLHLHEAIQRLLLKYLDQWKDRDVLFDPNHSRYVAVKKVTVLGDCAAPLQNGQVPNWAIGSKEVIEPKYAKDKIPSKKSRKRKVAQMEMLADNTSTTELPTPISGYVFSKSNVIQTTYSIRDHTQNVKHIVSKSTVLTSQDEVQLPGQDVPTDSVASTYSISGQRKVVLREAKDKRFVEVWKGDRIESSAEVTEAHGAFYSDEFVGSLSLSQSEDAIIYTAEANPPSKKDATNFERFRFTPSFGEGLPTRARPRTFLSLWKRGILRPINLSSPPSTQVHLGQAVFCGRSKLFAIGYDVTADARLLGVKGCFNRPSAIWQLDLPEGVLEGGDGEGELACSGKKISSPEVSSRSPRVPPSSDSVFWLTSALYGAHAAGSSLHCLDAATNESRVVVDTVWEPNSPSDFPGLYLDNLPQRPFLRLGGKLFVTCHSVWGSRTTVLLINTEDGQFTDLTPEDGKLYSWTVLGTDGEDRILCSRSTPTSPSEIILLQLDANDPQVKPAIRVVDAPILDDDLLAALEGVSVNVESIPGRFPTQAIVYKPSSKAEDSSPPLITIPHGGPHGTVTTAFSAGTVALALEGFTLSLPNYTGSLGFGEKYVSALLGHCGSLDVEDCIASVRHLVDTGVAVMGKGNQFVSGGSHGGFLTAHLIGQYPDIFSAAALRNPVVSVGEMKSDIPDWVYSELGLPFTPVSLITPEIYERLFKASPIAHVDKVDAKVLLLVGGSDMRVSPTQGIQYYHALKGRGKEVEMLWFDGEGHPLDGVEATRVGSASMPSKSNRVLHIPELLKSIFSNLPAEKNKHDYKYALVCKDWTEVALDFAWRNVCSLKLLLQLLVPLYYDEWTKRYYLRRPIEPSDWARFKKYHYRVRALSVQDEKIDSSVYTALSIDRASLILLPNLREMELSSSADLDVVLLFAHPSVTRFTLFMDSHAIDIALQYIRIRLPNLVDLTLFSNFSTPHTDTIIADTLRALPFLKELYLSTHFLTPEVTQILSKHKYLQCLHADSPGGDQLYSDDLSPDSFPSLTDLDITIPFDRASACFSRKFALSSLKNLSITSPYYEADNDFRRLTRAIAHTQPRLEIVRFEVFDYLHEDEQSSSAPFSIVKPFLSCKHITSLIFAHPVPFQPSAAEFISIFKSLPSIRILFLASGSPHFKPTHSMDVLYAISPWCPKLTSLSVYLDFNPSRGSPASVTPFSALSNLDVGYSPIQTPVVVAVSLSQILPGDCAVSYEDRELDERARKDWQTMISGLSALRLARRS
ncbi:hypothetical protein ONZ45_g12111 [Pleurotus djamor]|nr:hypothetical protein ONZ45_g12111 [Pleurotus djamor]